jgi:hypothetical protein
MFSCFPCCSKKLKEQEKLLEQKIREIETLEKTIQRYEKKIKLDKINSQYYGSDYSYY